MEPLATHFTEGRFSSTQIERHGMRAIYEQRHLPSGKGVRYEAIQIRIQRPHTWPDGTMTPEKEAYPSAGTWGRLGHTCFILAEAEAILAQWATRALQEAPHVL